jgi:arylsulfatase A-like enzyme
VEVLLWLALWSCTSGTPETVPATAPQVATPPPRRAVGALALARMPEGLTLTLPDTTRPGEPLDGTFPTVGAVKVRERADGVTVYAVPLPVHSDLFPTKQAGARSFGNFEPPDLTVKVRGKVHRFARYGREPGSYGYDRQALLIGLPPDAPAPTAADIVLTWPRATAREASLHLGTSGLQPPAFALRSLTVGVDAHTGLLLPAPATASWSVSLPERAMFDARGTLLPPAVVGNAVSDGAKVRLELDAAGGTVVVDTRALKLDDWVDWRVDLSAWAGQKVTLRLVSEPGPTSDFDLVFLEEPTVYTPSDHPKRVVIGFLDTVRRDHLGMYGYERPTTPKLDAWATGALRLDNHRTVAPWTLPSARAAITGHQPEAFFDVPTLPDELAAAGFYTSGIVANAYLSQTFDMQRGFAHYRYKHLLPADELVDHANEVFERHPDRDVMVWVQFMEAHLPYEEPPAYRSLFAGDKPDALRSVARTELVRLQPNHPSFEEIKTYVIARYDQNIRVLDDQVSRLIEQAGVQATVVLFSDHGEEFWEHGGYEHGHAFYEELLAVPMLVRDPHLQAGATDLPTSLLDLTPTVLDLVGLTPSERPGRSLVPVAFGDAEAQAALRARPHGFGRPLYGDDGWGVVHEGMKWTHRDGHHELYELSSDPEEKTDLSASRPLDTWPPVLSTALGVPVRQAWRISLRARPTKAPVTLTITHPSGLRQSWKGYDPRAEHEDVALTTIEGGVSLTQAPGQRLPDTIFVLPAVDGLPAGLRVQLRGPGLALDLTVPETLPAEGAWAGPADAQWRLRVDPIWAPEPTGQAVGAFHPDMAAELEELGYIEPGK